MSRSKATVEAADVRGRVERPHGFGVDALQGAFWRDRPSRSARNCRGRRSAVAWPKPTAAGSCWATGRRRRGPWRERIGGIPATRGVWDAVQPGPDSGPAAPGEAPADRGPAAAEHRRRLPPCAAWGGREGHRRQGRPVIGPPPHPGSARPGPTALRAGTVRTAHARASGTSGLVTACPTTATRHEERGLNSPPLSLAQPALRPSASRTRSPRSRRPRASKRSGSAVRPR